MKLSFIETTLSNFVEMEVLRDAYSLHPKITTEDVFQDPRLTREAKARLLRFYAVQGHA